LKAFADDVKQAVEQFKVRTEFVLEIHCLIVYRCNPRSPVRPSAGKAARDYSLNAKGAQNRIILAVSCSINIHI